MRIPAPLIAVGAAAAIVVAGCSMHGSSVSPSMGTGMQSVIAHPDYQLPHQSFSLTVKSVTALLGTHQYVSPDAGCGTGALLYVSQFDTNAIQIYKQSGKSQAPCATITASIVNPQGMNTNKTNEVYVANTGANDVLVFKKGGKTAVKTLADAGEYPVDVCVGSTGNIYATNIFATNGNPGSVTEWVGGKGTGKTLTVPNNSKVLFCALDNKNNLYVNYISTTTGAGAMVEFVGGKGTAKTTKVTTTFPGAMQFDNTQDLVGNDQSAFMTCTYELPNPKGKCHTYSGIGDLLGLSLNHASKDIYVGDAVGGSVYEYTYTGYKLVDTISTGLGSSSPPYGVTADPGLPN
jgi:hypothetical protein